MKHLIYAGSLIILLILACNDLVWGQPFKNLVEITPQFTLKSFLWGEYNDNSVQLLEEKGLLYSGGITSKIKFSRSFDLFTKFDAHYYSGLIDYDGFLQNPDGTTEPYKSKTGNEGLEAILDFGCNFIYQFSRPAKIFLNILGEYPLLITESIDLASRGQGGPADINLEPQSNIGLNIELGATTYGAFLSFYLDYLLFSKSAFDQGYHQPESDRTVVGMKLGYTFSIN